VNTFGTTIEQPPAQPVNGGYNTSVVVALPAGGLLPGTSLPVSIRLGGVVGGNYMVVLNVEAK
jgi:hypothetical protein